MIKIHIKWHGLKNIIFLLSSLWFSTIVYWGISVFAEHLSTVGYCLESVGWVGNCLCPLVAERRIEPDMNFPANSEESLLIKNKNFMSCDTLLYLRKTGLWISLSQLFYQYKQGHSWGLRGPVHVIPLFEIV